MSPHPPPEVQQEESPQRPPMHAVASSLPDIQAEQPGQLSILAPEDIFSDAGANEQERKHRNFSLENYTIDLAALGHSSSGGRDQFGITAPSDFVFDIPTQGREEVPSEDDGPTDFTVNLGAWMRGKKTAQQPRSIMFEHEEPQYMAHKVSVGDPWVEESAFAPINVSTPSRLEEGDRGHNSSTTPLSPGDHAPAEQRHEMAHEGAENASEEVQRLRVEITVWRENSERLEQRISEEIMCQLESKHAAKVAEERRMEESMAHGATKSQLDALQQDAQAAKLESDGRIASLEAHVASSQRELSDARDLATGYDGKESEIELLRAQISQQQQDLLLQADKLKIHEEDLAARTKTINDLQVAARETTSTNTVLRTELEHAQQQLSETRRLLESAEQENDRFTHEHHRHDEEVSSLRNELAEATLLHAQDKESALLEAQTKIHELALHVESLRTELKAQPAPSPLGSAVPQTSNAASSDTSSANEADNALGDALDRLSSHYEAQLDAQKQEHAVETKKLKKTLLKAAEGMKKREDKMARTHEAELATLRTELATKYTTLEESARSLAAETDRRHCSLAEARPSTSPTHAELRSAIATLASKLQTSHAQLQSVQSSLRSTQASLAASRAAMHDQAAMHAEVNRELEARLAEKMQRREAEWRERVKTLLKEREKMSKVLLWTWGEQEVGRLDGGGKDGAAAAAGSMGYRYKYVHRRAGD